AGQVRRLGTTPHDPPRRCSADTFPRRANLLFEFLFFSMIRFSYDHRLSVDCQTRSVDLAIADFFQQFRNVKHCAWPDNQLRGRAPATGGKMVKGIRCRFLKNCMTGIWAANAQENVVFAGKVGDGVPLSFTPVLTSDKDIDEP